MSEEEENIFNNNLSDTEAGIFKKSNYNLDLNKRKAKLGKFNVKIVIRKLKASVLCYNCYNQEIGDDEQYRMNYGICEVCSKPNTSPLSCCKIFKTSDYDLNLYEREEKYKDCNHVYCEKCNQEINEDYYCYDCYEKETDNNKQNWMKYGGKFVIFKTSDDDLNLSERKEKYKDYDHIFCEKCNQEINKEDYYCYDCYDKETDNNEKNWMKYGGKFVIFKTSDYDLNLEERIMKYMGYNHIYCEKCNQKIESSNFICYNCYNQETDDERYRMNYGVCDVCSKPNTPLGCCKIFRTSDYDLYLNERIAKYKNFNYIQIFCEKCNKEINKEGYRCDYCYDKETDNNKRNWMKYGRKVDFKTSDYDLTLKERKEKYKDYDHIFCEKCNQEINNDHYYCCCCYDKETDNNKRNWMECGGKFVIFKTSDYDLNLKERKKKYMDYNYIHCEKCNQKINTKVFYCANCYDKETDNNKQNWMKCGRKFVIFKISDYNLNLKERKKKYMDYNYIHCEKCNQKINTKVFYCANCYDKETDNNKQNWMKCGRKFVIFKISDYNLNLVERKKKYKDYDHIFCEKCNQNINTEVFYCANCYDKETDNHKQNWMKYGRKVRTFKTSDYDLNLKERKEKYLDYNHIFCEECNQEIIKKNHYYCNDCYNKKTDISEQNHMKYGICKVCFKSNVAFNSCSFCLYKKNYFKTSDYDLITKRREEKYLDYDHIFCEECDQEINRESYYCCYYCYDTKSYDEKNRMKYGKCKVCLKSNTKHISSCSTYQLKQYLEDLDIWFHEYDKVNNLPKKLKVGISDYYLYEDERQVKYNDYDRILCEKCNKKIYYYCYDCYDKKTKELEELQSKLQDYKIFYFKLYDRETKELRELEELQSILKDYENVYFNLNYDDNDNLNNDNLNYYNDNLNNDNLNNLNLNYYNDNLNNDNLNNRSAVQQIINGSIKNEVENVETQIKNIRYNSGHHEINGCNHKLYSYCYDCYNKETDSNEKKRIELGRCKECFQINEGLNDCSLCRSKRIQRDFNRWSSGNKTIDKLIQDNQLSAKRYELLEWIPHDKFTDIKHIADGGFAKVYSATWIDGQIKKWSQLSNNWKRSGPLTVALKVLNNSENISEDFLNEIKFFNKVNSDMCVIKCFGITQDPETHNYALVLQYMESGDLRSYLRRTVNSLTWQRRLNNIYDICLALKNIHIHKLMHKDLHPGNIFIGTTFAYIGDFGFCMPANENLSNSTKKNVYGVMPFMAPEILRGKPYTLASDVYSLGVIINEIITVIPPFNNQPHDLLLALDICRGLRPNISRIETPDSLRELIEKCWDANPKKRPTSEEVLYTFSNNLNVYKNMPLKILTYNFNNESTNITLDKKMQLKTHSQASYTSQLYNFQNLPEPMNCPNQQEFISSRNIQSVIRSNESLESCMIMDDSTRV